MKKVFQIIGIAFLYLCEIAAFYVSIQSPSIMGITLSPIYALFLLLMPSFYLVYRLYQVCITKIPFANFEVGLLFLNYITCIEAIKVFRYPFASIIWISWGLMGIFFSIFYVYKHPFSDIHNKRLYVLILFLSSAIVCMSGYHLISGNKIFNWRF